MHFQFVLSFLSTVLSLVLATTTDQPSRCEDVSVECKCPSSVFGPADWEGDLKSPRGPDGNYCPCLECDYTITAGPKGTAIRIHFTRNEIGFGGYLEVNQTEHEDAIRIDRINGNRFVEDMISSEGNGFTLRFHSDESQQYLDRGFEAKFTRLNVTSTDCICPKIFYEASDEVQSITYPIAGKSYCKRIKCHFVVQTSRPYAVKLSLNWLEIDSHDKISIFDIEDTRDGFHGTSDRVLEWTGRAIDGIEQKEFTGTSRGFLVLFETDSQTGGTGFSIQFQKAISPCNCVSTRMYVPPNGEHVFTSPGYPLPYCNNYDCTHTFYTNSSYVIQYELNVFNTQYWMDNLEVKENLDGTDSILQKWSGKPIREQVVYTTNSNESSLRFSTNNDDYSRGFNVSCRSIKRNPACSCGTVQPFTFSEWSGLIPAVIYDGDCPSIDCKYYFERPSDAQDLQFKFSLNAPKPFGHLALYRDRMYEGSNPQPVEKWVGRVKTTETMALTNRFFVLQYHSESTEVNDHYSGFNLSFEWRKSCSCGNRNLIAEEFPQRVMSPNYPSEYCNNVRCTYTITAPCGMHVVLSIDAFLTENINDYLTLYDDDDHDSYLAKYSGVLTPLPKLIRSSGRHLTLHFKTNGRTVGSGFSAQYFSDMRGENPTESP